MNPFPAIVLGGPPHSGKSVLAYNLSQSLRRRGIQHYVLRAYPDGEGDWSNQADQTLVRAIRVKGLGSREWTDRICRDIANRPLPLIVDPGGKPTGWQEAIFAQCTHAILLCPDDDSQREWANRFHRHGLITLADLHSVLDGQERIADAGTPLRGELAGLERGVIATGPTYNLLVERLAQLLALPENALLAHHLATAPTELVLELNRLGQTLKVFDVNQQWQPSALKRVLDYLPSGTPLALYGRAPNWLYAAIARYAYPAPIYQFDARLGWISPPQISIGQAETTSPLGFSLVTMPDHLRIEIHLREAYLDYTEAEQVRVPAVPANYGVVLSGKLPLWLWTAIALAYHRVLWLAIYQPQLIDRAVVTYSVTPCQPLGNSIVSPMS